MDSGDYFEKATSQNPGALKDNIGMNYYKSTEWKIEPAVKGPVPQDLNYNLPEGTEASEQAFFSIDGEKYPAQNVTGKVIP